MCVLNFNFNYRAGSVDEVRELLTVDAINACRVEAEEFVRDIYGIEMFDEIRNFRGTHSVAEEVNE